MNDDDKMLLRDKLAIEILNGLLSTDGIKGMVSEYCAYFEDKGNKDHVEMRMERLIRCSYKIADMMRKVRLATFD